MGETMNENMNETINMNETKNLRHTGRMAQTVIYLGKLFRMFIFQNDWKVLPMSAIIAGLVAFAVGNGLFTTMEGTLKGTFALSCVCIWNGLFNSIQSICRERAIIKREHRSGMHISSYIAAHMIYQFVLCAAQSVIFISVCKMLKVTFPTKSILTGWPLADIWITLFLTTYCADMLALLVSSIARTTTTAMTVMPFLLIVQLVFSGAIFPLPSSVQPLSNLTISKWGLTALCSQGDYNSLPMVTMWNALVKMGDAEIAYGYKLKDALVYMEDNGLKEEFMAMTAEHSQKAEYTYDIDIVAGCWGWIMLWTLVYVILAVLSLERIDKDRR